MQEPKLNNKWKHRYVINKDILIQTDENPNLFLEVLKKAESEAVKSLTSRLKLVGDSIDSVIITYEDIENLIIITVTET